MAFGALVAGVAALRVAELRLSARNARALRARGGREHARGQMPVMRAVHAAWFVSMLAERASGRTTRRGGALRVAAGLAGLGAGVAVRAASQRALGDRWTATVVTVPGEPRVTSGVYRLGRHPNYAGVAVEIAAVPLVGGAWRTAAVFSLVNAALLAARIRAEDAALDAADRAG